jgi:hypothetical protein
MAVTRRDNWGGGIFIYSCSHTVKTIAFKINQSGRIRVYEYAPPPPNYRSSYMALSIANMAEFIGFLNFFNVKESCLCDVLDSFGN